MLLGDPETVAVTMSSGLTGTFGELLFDPRFIEAANELANELESELPGDALSLLAEGDPPPPPPPVIAGCAVGDGPVPLGLLGKLNCTGLALVTPPVAFVVMPGKLNWMPALGWALLLAVEPPMVGLALVGEPTLVGKANPETVGGTIVD